ncbi:MAG: VOC family protein [Brucellaceae bacterium]|nr:VOC family protein [Brucellaceae bacterium]
MSEDNRIEAPRIYPTFRYRNSGAMLTWLTETVGFREIACYRADDGSVAHAELAYGSSMIMIGHTKDDDYGAMVGQSGETGGKSIYVAVDDVDGLFQRVSSAGTTIEEGITERDYGSREFICRDAEGNLWCFGTYWPKADG